MSHYEIEEQLQDLVDGKLDETTRVDLVGRLKEDPELLKAYCQYGQLQSAFHRMSTSQNSLGEELASVGRASRVRSRRRSLRVAALATAAILVLLGIILAVTFVRKPEPMLVYRTSPGTVFDVSHELEGDDEPEPGVLAEGSRVVVSRGCVELKFGSGVEAVVRAPADLTLHTEDKLYLAEGAAWVHVPKKAVGFRVQTPEFTVIDLGTEFGVRSLKNLQDEVHVFDGSVEIRAFAGVSATETLSAGMARSVTVVGRFSEISQEPSHFFTSLPEGLPYLHWSFDEPASDGIPSGGSHPIAGRKASEFVEDGKLRFFTSEPGRFGEALVIPERLAYAETEWAGISGNAPRTVSHWIKLSPKDPSLHRGAQATQPIVGWGSHNFTPFAPNTAFLSYIRVVEHGTVAGVSLGSYYLDGTTPIDDGEWHHFAIVYHGRNLPNGEPELYCYLDGRLEKTNRRGDEFRVDTATTVSDSLKVTLLAQDWSSPYREHNISMSLDELYIFETALDEEQVLDLYENNRYRN